MRAEVIITNHFVMAAHQIYINKSKGLHATEKPLKKAFKTCQASLFMNM